jgi:predicted amidophosphoribosyltransferase
MMGRWVAQAGHELLADADALVPVPLGHAGGDDFKRVKATVQQVGLSRAERGDNIQGAFRVPETGKAAVAGRRSAWFWSMMC